MFGPVGVRQLEVALFGRRRQRVLVARTVLVEQVDDRSPTNPLAGDQLAVLQPSKVGRIGTASRFTCVRRSRSVSWRERGAGFGVRRLTGDPTPPADVVMP
jgi:hypothetical protein